MKLVAGGGGGLMKTRCKLSSLLPINNADELVQITPIWTHGSQVTLLILPFGAISYLSRSVQVHSRIAGINLHSAPTCEVSV